MSMNFDISLLAGGLPFDGSTLEHRSLGGAESAAVYMAKALARCGAHVAMFCNTQSASSDDAGVLYQPIQEWPAFAQQVPHDICIVQRAVRAFSQRTNARLNVLWCHDLALGRDAELFRGTLWNIDRTILLSEYMRQQYCDALGLDSDTFVVSRNGVDLALFAELKRLELPRSPKKLIFAARPERGLDLLLRHIMPRLLKVDSEFRLYLARYDNPTSEWADFYRECDRLASGLGDRVVTLGSLSKRELYKHYLSAALYVYPTPSPILPGFREVSCITAMECQAAGLPIVTTAIGALSETIASGAGSFIRHDPSRVDSLHAYIDEFVAAVHTLSSDGRRWHEASSHAIKAASGLGWARLADDWLCMFEDAIRAGNSSRARLVRHFWRTSDIVMAKEVLRGLGTDECERPALTRLLSAWSFMDEPDGYRKQYERIGPTHDPAVYATTPKEMRFAVLEHWLRENQASIRTIIDFGCAHGAYALGLVERLEHITIHGTDIDHNSTDMARERAIRFNLSERATFSVWDGDSRVGPSGSVSEVQSREYDCALVQEVLEHVPSPWATLQEVERLVRAGGKVYITVPFGPWEFTSYRKYPHRCHLWHFDAHDLRDMIGAKPDFQLAPLYAEDNPITGDPQGWWIATYTADHSPIAAVNTERHIWLQRPRQSVSVAIIAGPGAEETLHWSLRSIQDLADEVVIADCGMSGESRRIVAQYDVKVLSGRNPRVEGFERARNEVLDACSGDWCLWIDTDEHLVGQSSVEKYLRDNVYRSYSIRQHNFACDVPGSVDVPARLFRRRQFEGKVIRFWGAIHEHPELSLNAGAGPTLCLPDVNIAHVGYLSEGVRRMRMARNSTLLKLDQERYPERLLQKYFVMRDNIQGVRHKLLANGGVVDDEVTAKCRETVGLFRAHFLGRRTQWTRDSSEYYSEALAILGEGFEAVFQIETDKSQAVPNGVRRQRFASAEDFYAELKRVAIEKAKRFDSPWW
jgi:glycosyltransferase involved in cell wall biosynthesis/SAM-dependent methyltransferase